MLSRFVLPAGVVVCCLVTTSTSAKRHQNKVKAASRSSPPHPHAALRATRPHRSVVTPDGSALSSVPLQLEAERGPPVLASRKSSMNRDTSGGQIQQELSVDADATTATGAGKTTSSVSFKQSPNKHGKSAEQVAPDREEHAFLVVVQDDQHFNANGAAQAGGKSGTFFDVDSLDVGAGEGPVVKEFSNALYVQLAVNNLFLIAAVAMLVLGEHCLCLTNLCFGFLACLAVVMAFPSLFASMVDCCGVHSQYSIAVFWAIPCAVGGVCVACVLQTGRMLFFVMGAVAGWFVASPVVGFLEWAIGSCTENDMEFNKADANWHSGMHLALTLMVLIVSGCIFACVFKKAVGFVYSIVAAALLASSLGEMLVLFAALHSLGNSDRKPVTIGHLLSETIGQAKDAPKWAFETIFPMRLPLPFQGIREIHTFANLSKKAVEDDTEWPNKHAAESFLKAYSKRFPLQDGLCAWAILLSVFAVAFFFAHCGCGLCGGRFCLGAKNRKAAPGSQSGSRSGSGRSTPSSRSRSNSNRSSPRSGGAPGGPRRSPRRAYYPEPPDDDEDDYDLQDDDDEYVGHEGTISSRLWNSATFGQAGRHDAGAANPNHPHSVSISTWLIRHEDDDEEIEIFHLDQDEEEGRSGNWLM